MPTRVYGWIAVSLSLIYKFPQMYKLHITHNTQGISVFSQIVQASAYAFYVAHGFVIGDPPVVFLGATSMLQSIVLITQYFCYRNEPQNIGSFGQMIGSTFVQTNNEDNRVEDKEKFESTEAIER